MTVRCEVRPDAGASGTADRREIGEWLQHRIKTLVGVSADIDVGMPDSIERTLVGKARRVVDQRPKG
jgi:phenylacetate-CoA ligase